MISPVNHPPPIPNTQKRLFQAPRVTRSLVPDTFDGGNVLALKQAQLITMHAQLGLPDKGRTIKDLVVCNSWDLEPLGTC